MLNNKQRNVPQFNNQPSLVTHEAGSLINTTFGEITVRKYQQIEWDKQGTFRCGHVCCALDIKEISNKISAVASNVLVFLILT